MIPKRYLFFLCLSVLGGCAKFQNSPTILNDKLSSSYKNISESLIYKRSKLLFSGEQKADNCNSYYKLILKHNLEEFIRNQIIKSEYLICDALKILSGSSEFPIKKSNMSNLGDKILSKLDLRSFPSSQNRVSSEAAHTLRALYPGKVSHIDNIAELRTEDWEFTLEVVALARINDNLTFDWIVWVFDESKSGNYRSYSTIVIYDPEEQETFGAEVFP